MSTVSKDQVGIFNFEEGDTVYLPGSGDRGGEWAKIKKVHPDGSVEVGVPEGGTKRRKVRKMKHGDGE